MPPYLFLNFKRTQGPILLLRIRFPAFEKGVKAKLGEIEWSVQAGIVN